MSNMSNSLRFPIIEYRPWDGSPWQQYFVWWDYIHWSNCSFVFRAGLN